MEIVPTAADGGVLSATDHLMDSRASAASALVALIDDHPPPKRLKTDPEAPSPPTIREAGSTFGCSSGEPQYRLVPCPARNMGPVSSLRTAVGFPSQAPLSTTHLSAVRIRIALQEHTLKTGVFQIPRGLPHGSTVHCLHKSCVAAAGPSRFVWCAACQGAYAAKNFKARHGDCGKSSAHIASSTTAANTPGQISMPAPLGGTLNGLMTSARCSAGGTQTADVSGSAAIRTIPCRARSTDVEHARAYLTVSRVFIEV